MGGLCGTREFPLTLTLPPGYRGEGTGNLSFEYDE